jgi:lia operon protein LiaG
MKFKKDKSMNRAILGGAFVIIALLGVFGLFNGNKDDKNPIAAINSAGTNRVELEATMSINGLRSIEFTGVSSDITVTRTNSNTITVKVTGNARIAPDLISEKNGSMGTFEVKWPKSITNNARDMKMQIFLPADYQENVSFRSVSGDINLTERSNFNDVKLNSVSGDIRNKETSSRSYSASTVSGDLSLSDIFSENTSLSSVSGDIDYNGSLESLTASSVSGDCNFSLDSLTGRIKLNSTSGDIELRLPESISASIDFSTVSGDLSSDIPILTTGSKKNHLSGTIGGGNHSIEGHSVSGDIHISKN